MNQQRASDAIVKPASPQVPAASRSAFSALLPAPACGRTPSGADSCAVARAKSDPANGPQLRAISLWEPWATAMALELKRNETRSWPTAHRGPLAICSAKRPLDQDALAVARENGISLNALRFGCVLCVVELFDCTKSQAFLSGMLELTEQEQALGDYTYGRWIWRTRNCRRLETPVPVVGHQGFWTLPPETLALVKANLPVLGRSAEQAGAGNVAS